MDKQDRFSQWVFRIAGVYGILVLAPQYLLEEKLGRDFPPPITHPEHFYGFIGVALAWQVAFLIIASAPKRFRPLMLAAILEKLSFGVAAVTLFVQGRIVADVAAFGLIDLVFAALFAAAWQATASESRGNEAT